MNKLAEHYKAMLLMAIFLLGIDSLTSSVVIVALQDFWSTTCNIYPDSGFWCENNSMIAYQILALLVAFSLGYLLLVKWLKLISVKKLRLVTVTFTVLVLLATVYWYDHLLEVNEVGVYEEYLNSAFVTFLNWSDEILAALISSLWLLVPTRTKGEVGN